MARLTGGRADDDPAALVGDGRLLLVLDNVEHLVAPCARRVDDLIRSCRQVSTLVTSCERLRLPYEAVWTVLPLAVDAPGDAGLPSQAPAVRLFARRAMQMRPDFRLTAENLDTVTSICGRFDGLPLAIELAAACMAADTLDALKARVARRLRNLNPPRRYQPARRHSLWSTLRRSMDCLSDAER
jgi:predicted ATPase